MARKLPDFVTYEEYLKYLNGIKKSIPKIKEGRRKEYLLATILAYEGGLRISEIIGYKDHIPPLNSNMIDMGRKTIKVVSGKGGKDRVVPLPSRFSKNALDLLPLRFHRRSLQHFTEVMTKKILGRKLSFHKFRHGFGSRLANQNVPLHQIQFWMGHSRIDTTGLYLHSSPSEENIDRVRELF